MMPVVKIVLITTSLGLFFSASLMAQTELEIRTGDYLTGEAFIVDGNEASAKEMAKKDLVQSIFQTVVMNQVYEINENNNSISDKLNINLESFSSINLGGIRFLSYKNKEDKPVMKAFISVEDYQASVKKSADETVSILKTADQTEKTNGLADASLLYYDAWLKTFSVPDLIRYKPADSPDTVIAKTYIRKKLTDFLNGIKIENAGIAEEMEAHYTAQVRGWYSGKLVRNLRIASRDPSIDAKPIIDGSGKLHIHRIPGSPTETIELILLPPLPENDQAAARIEATNSLLASRKIDIDYLPIIAMDFRIDGKSDGYLDFTPQIRNFSISKLEWDFGDGYQAIEPRPSHKFEKNATYKVTLTVNGEYKVIKEIDQTGKVFSSKRTLEPRKTPHPDKPIELFPSPTPSSGMAKGNTFQKVKKDLAALSDGDLLFDYLNSAKNTGRLTFGKESQFIRPDDCLIAAVDSKTRQVLAVLEKQGTGWVNQKNNQEIRSVSDQFKGQIVIWVQVF
ncbi:MAG: PKD domain-containing protein [Bacteroidetes bacterium]|nr:PKD domain-containing protein [Bacteroidota bacterium]